MQRTLASFASFAGMAAMLFTASSAHAGATAQQKVAAVQYLVGTWNCAHTVGTFSGTYTTHWSNALGNLWLRQVYDFPPAPAQEAAVATHAEFLTGYDERRQAWVRFGILSTGQYFAIRMTETDGGWSWKYVSFFSRSTPETADSDATFTKRSDSEYVVDGPSYKQGSALVREHHVCKKQ
jgi:hypothetical protein